MFLNPQPEVLFTYFLSRLTPFSILLRGAVSLLVFFALFSLRAAGTPPQKGSSPTRVQAAVSKLPLYFIENRGQVDERVHYYVQGKETTLYFTPQGVTFVLDKPRPVFSQVPPMERNGFLPVALQSDSQPTAEPQRWVLKLDFVGANPNVVPQGQEVTPAVMSYFKGSRDQWQTGLPTYRSLVYPELWPGIDLVYSGTGGHLKYTFVVRPGADPQQIKLAYRGATNISLTAQGQLDVRTPVGGFMDDTPYAYQDVEGQRMEVAATYALAAFTVSDVQVYGFEIGDYDSHQELIETWS
jgi:hypothetical protein